MMLALKGGGTGMDWDNKTESLIWGKQSKLLKAKRGGEGTVDPHEGGSDNQVGRINDRESQKEQGRGTRERMFRANDGHRGKTSKR